MYLLKNDGTKHQVQENKRIRFVVISSRRLNEQKQEYRRDFAHGDIFTVQYPGLTHNRKDPGAASLQS